MCVLLAVLLFLSAVVVVVVVVVVILPSHDVVRFVKVWFIQAMKVVLSIWLKTIIISMVPQRWFLVSFHYCLLVKKRFLKAFYSSTENPRQVGFSGVSQCCFYCGFLNASSPE